MNKAPMYVKVSDFYYGNGWPDSKTKIWFKKSSGIIEIPAGSDLSNINRYLKFHYLEDVTYQIQNNKKQITAEPEPNVITSTPKQLMEEKYKAIEVIEEEDEITEEVPSEESPKETEIDDKTEVQEEIEEVDQEEIEEKVLKETDSIETEIIDKVVLEKPVKQAKKTTRKKKTT